MATGQDGAEECLVKEVSHAVLDIQDKLYKFINPSRNFDAVMIMVSTAKAFCHVVLAAHITLPAYTVCNVAGIDTFAYWPTCQTTPDLFGCCQSEKKTIHSQQGCYRAC